MKLAAMSIVLLSFQVHSAAGCVLEAPTKKPPPLIELIAASPMIVIGTTKEVIQEVPPNRPQPRRPKGNLILQVELVIAGENIPDAIDLTPHTDCDRHFAAGHRILFTGTFYGRPMMNLNEPLTADQRAMLGELIGRILDSPPHQ